MSNRKFYHPYKCPVCFDGTVERELWEMLYGKKLNLHTCGSSHKHLVELKVWIGEQLDAIDNHGCESCWSDNHSGCTCKEEREQMKAEFLKELPSHMNEVGKFK
jgi:hypothetical protein